MVLLVSPLPLFVSVAFPLRAIDRGRHVPAPGWDVGSNATGTVTRNGMFRQMSLWYAVPHGDGVRLLGPCWMQPLASSHAQCELLKTPSRRQCLLIAVGTLWSGCASTLFSLRVSLTLRSRTHSSVSSIMHRFLWCHRTSNASCDLSADLTGATSRSI